ncbi:MAG TPA: hypothetical protein PLI19_03820, partial [Erysipelotrichaceae bacterium]|nr:hypothetical protein [Erysipelotrichaceae bacterium]
DTSTLEGKLGVGPESQKDTNQIWNDISRTPKQLGDYIQEYHLRLSGCRLIFRFLHTVSF